MRVAPSLLLALVGAGGLPAQAGEFVWHQDLDAARELAAGEGKPLLVMFRCEP